jgi:hypothetical protein
MAEKPKIPAVIAKPAAPAAKVSTGGYSGIPTTKAATTGGYSGIPTTTKTVTPTPTKSTTTKTTTTPSPYNTTGPFNPQGGVGTGTYGPSSTSTTAVPETPTFAAAGTFAGYEVSADGKTRRARFHDGKGGFYYGSSEPNPDAKKEKVSNVAYDTIQKILESYRITGLASVLETIRDEYPEASSEDILTLLQFDSRYNAKFNERFAANTDRLKAGKPVLSPSEYLKLEQGYMKVFNAYNLPTFNTQSYYDSFIKGDVDIEEVTDRVQLGYDRVLNDKAVQDAFNKFFSALGFSDIVAGMLDTTNQLPALERKVKAAEIGGAALRQGLVASELAATEAQANVGYTNVSRGTLGADVLGRQGVTKAQAEEGYKKIAQVLPTAEKLSSIYGGTEEQYGRLEAEQEQLQGLASAARKKQRLIELETAQFKRSSGLSKGALKSTTNI